MKIVVLDGITENPGDLSWSSLEQLGDLTVHKRTESEDEAVERTADAQILVLSRTKITRRVLDACPSVRFITVLSPDHDAVDHEYAAEKGIPVANVPDFSKASVSQSAVALLLEICNHVGHHDLLVKSGRWSASKDFCLWDYPLIELDGKTAGIIGFGETGQKTARAVSALGMKVIVYDSSEAGSDQAFCEFVSLPELLSGSDVIFLHCPLSGETKDIINKNSIAQMKDGVIIINNSNGQLIAEDDLCDALESRKVYAAGLDVTAVEPVPLSSRLLQQPYCFLTPHISWSSIEARQRIMDATAENIKAFIDGVPVNIVNM